MKPLIFSGTTEGRKISERLSADCREHIVCVATPYGGLVMEPTPFADVRQGRLTEEEMERIIRLEADIVFDATHPYAAEVSKNIRAACEAAGKEYVRIVRDEDKEPAGSSIRIFENAEACSEALKDTEGNILLTTGSKELHIYAAEPSIKERLFVRVLPSEESIGLCSKEGIRGRQVIAMQGPFSSEMNLAVIRQYDIRTLVTKASGSAGGFDEKIEAAAAAGIQACVIGRPEKEEGISAAEALKTYFRLTPSIRIDLVGTGPGRGTLMTEEAGEAVRKAVIICGAERMIEAYSERETYPYYRAEDIISVIEKKQPERLAVLFSGDLGFYSGAAKMKPVLSEWLFQHDYDFDIQVHPGVSSFAYLAAKVGITYSGASFCSIHGRSEDVTAFAEMTNTAEENEKTFVLMSGPEDVRKMGSCLMGRRPDRYRVILGKDLSYPGETVRMLSPAACTEVSEPGLYTALILNEDVSVPRLMPVISDEEFTRSKVPMTKENIRHLSIIKLGLKEGSLLYDIGSGTGSIACEAAMQSEKVRVFAIEMKEEACELIKKNAAGFGLPNVEVICGAAPEAFEGLESPTHAFIGGSSGRLKDILQALGNGPNDVRVVINAVSLETMVEIQTVLGKFDISDLTIEQIAVSRSRELGSYHLMTAENPVMIASFTLKGKQ